MSGVELLFAIGGFAFGIIQAYDSSLRIIEKIKARRQARHALPPSEYLEKSLQRGQRNIREMMEAGTERFPDFQEGDRKSHRGPY